MVKTVYKSYKYRLYPTPKDKELLSLHFGHCRFVYNYFLKEKQEFYLKSKNTLNYNNCSQALTTLKKQKEYVWLKDVNSQSLQQSLKNLETAFGKFFSKKAKFPKFKRKDGNNSFSIPQNVVIKGSQIYIPKFRNGIRFTKHRPLMGKICSATISKKPSGKYYVSILTKQNVCIPDTVDLSKTVGLDLGIKDFVITSDGSRFPNLEFQKKYQSKLSKLQNRFAKKQKGSNRKEKLRIKIAKLYEKITNSREDMQHKLSSFLVNKYDVICLETLAVKNMMQNHKLAYAIANVSWSSMVQKLEYKAAWKGKKIIKIDHFYPSSKTCHNCGYINQNLTLKDRMWVCPKCGTVLDRDENAAKNILTRGFTILSSATDDYRHGAEIRLVESKKDSTSTSNEVSKIGLDI